MDGHEGQAQPSGFHPNGLLPDQAASVTRVLDSERWSQAENRVAELIACIQPNQASEDKRNAIESYMKRLITECFSCQVFACGSVPLKTYLSDGDIDLAAFSKNQNLNQTWCIKLKEVLDKEMEREDAEFCVKDVKIISATVNIIKCLVENIVVDISFNQLSGLCALCYLEEVDNLINNNHLFKRSIILIKAWCYYESRTLGAQHSLISTYALEILILYIFHVFNNSFAGPLEVLYRFLEFYSKFDWDNFCVSLWGPVPKRSIIDMAADPPRRDGEELSLSKLVYACTAASTVLCLVQGNPKSPFSLSYFNIIDPLLTNNNLGKSVTKGNFSRILSAFSYGARQLARLLNCPKENLIADVDHFFQDTWDRHGKGHLFHAPSPEINASYRTGNVSAVSHIESHKGLQNISSAEKSHTDKGRSSRSDPLRNEVHGRNLSGRAHSSPELMDVSAKVPPGWKHSSVTESGGRTASNGSKCLRRKSSSQSSFHQNTAPSISHATSNSYSGGSGLGYMGKDCYPVADNAQMYREEQDYRNIMASTGYNFDGRVHMPMNLTFGDLPPVFPLGYYQMIPAGMAPTHIPAFQPVWIANMHDSQDLTPSPASQSIPGVGMESNLEETTEEDGANGLKKS